MKKIISLVSVIVSLASLTGCATSPDAITVATVQSGPCAGKGGNAYVACLERIASNREMPPPAAFPAAAPGQPPFGALGPFGPFAQASVAPANVGPLPVRDGATVGVVDCNNPATTFVVNNTSSADFYEVRGLNVKVAACDARQLVPATVMRHDKTVERVLLVPPHRQYSEVKMAFVMPAGAPVDRVKVTFEAYRNQGGGLPALAIGNITNDFSVPAPVNAMRGNFKDLPDGAYYPYKR